MDRCLWNRQILCRIFLSDGFGLPERKYTHSFFHQIFIKCLLCARHTVQGPRGIAIYKTTAEQEQAGHLPDMIFDRT